MARPSEPIKHGTISGYAKRCRCDKCRTAMSEHRYFQRHGGGPQTFKHGTLWGYQGRGCRCELCSRVQSTDARVRAGGTAPKLATPRYGTAPSERSGIKR